MLKWFLIANIILAIGVLTIATDILFFAPKRAALEASIEERRAEIDEIDCKADAQISFMSSFGLLCESVPEIGGRTRETKDNCVNTEFEGALGYAEYAVTIDPKGVMANLLNRYEEKLVACNK